MGIPVLILGESGTGKSCSMRNLDPQGVVLFNVASKPLPFRARFPYTVNRVGYSRILASLKKGTAKRYVIDDSQYLMAFEEFDHANETGYGKFTTMALNFYNVVKYVIESTPPDCIVYFLHHTEMTDAGRVKAKTVGKMIDSKLTLEGLFSIVLRCHTDGSRHWFSTQSDGCDTCKSPMDMFPSEIDNDLRLVDDTIREYYEFNKEEKSND